MNRGYVWSTSSERKKQTVKEILQRVCDRALFIANTRKTFCPDFGISYGVRSAEEQFELFKIGRIRIENDVWRVIGDVVTYCDGYDILSIHQTELAIDFFVWVDNKISQDPAQYALVATCFFEAASDVAPDYDMDWGGSFKSISDLGHVELRKRNINEC